MAFWILVVGLPAAAAALTVGFALSWKLGAAIVAGALVALVVADLATRPSHLERLVARDPDNADSEGQPSAHCHRTRFRYHGVRLNDCRLQYLFFNEHVCVALLAGDELQYFESTRCRRATAD
jgi:hypothetical protein